MIAPCLAKGSTSTGQRVLYGHGAQPPISPRPVTLANLRRNSPNDTVCVCYGGKPAGSAGLGGPAPERRRCAAFRQSAVSSQPDCFAAEPEAAAPAAGMVVQLVGPSGRAQNRCRWRPQTPALLALALGLALGAALANSAAAVTTIMMASSFELASSSTEPSEGFWLGVAPAVEATFDWTSTAAARTGRWGLSVSITKLSSQAGDVTFLVRQLVAGWPGMHTRFAGSCRAHAHGVRAGEHAYACVGG